MVYWVRVTTDTSKSHLRGVISGLYNNLIFVQGYLASHEEYIKSTPKRESSDNRDKRVILVRLEPRASAKQVPRIIPGL